MPPFAFKSDSHFVGSSDGTILQIYKLTKPTIHLSSVRKADWKKIATIDMGLEQEEEEENDDNYDEDDEGLAYERSYYGLTFFDGHGRIEGQQVLTTLAKYLKELHLLVNPEGYCFQHVSELGMYSDFGIHYLRLNDLFSWPRYGVRLVKINPWSRLELKLNPSKHMNPSKPTSSLEKYEELKHLLMKKDEELKKLKQEMEVENHQELQKEKEELRKEVGKKDNELRMLREDFAKRIEKLEKLNEDKEEANRAKNEELQKLKRNEEAKTSRIEELEGAIEVKNEELRKIERENDGGGGEKCRGRIEELEKLNEAKEDELGKLRQETKNKDEELQMCGKEVEKLQGEMEKKNDELEGNSRKVEALELEMLRENVKHLTRRRVFPPQSITCHPQQYYTNNKLLDILMASDVIPVRFADNNMYERPPADSLIVYTGGELFDVENWWTVTVSLPSGHNVVLAYYDGNFSQIFLQGFNQGIIISVPFSGDTVVTPFNLSFILVHLDPFGFRLGFIC